MFQERPERDDDDGYDDDHRHRCLGRCASGAADNTVSEPDTGQPIWYLDKSNNGRRVSRTEAFKS